uniref:Putative neurotoxin 4 n=1 Tax=Scolopendra mutilans TaxID=2836329 RepID=PNX64_SCOMU|nr:RecName: Full=Putative neurotoxin 4; AltName: Full=Putative neurotoxin 5; Flags: Precursor [Scolopendra mutilans]AFM55024.1 putative neurotoxin 5 [Scolopendra subspinipes]
MKSKFAVLFFTLFLLALAIDNVTTICPPGCICNRQSVGLTCKPSPGSDMSARECLKKTCSYGYC